MFHFSRQEWIQPSLFSKGNAYICRTTSPYIGLVCALLFLLSFDENTEKCVRGEGQNTQQKKFKQTNHNLPTAVGSPVDVVKVGRA